LPTLRIHRLHERRPRASSDFCTHPVAIGSAGDGWLSTDAWTPGVRRNPRMANCLRAREQNKARPPRARPPPLHRGFPQMNAFAIPLAIGLADRRRVHRPRTAATDLAGRVAGAGCVTERDSSRENPSAGPNAFRRGSMPILVATPDFTPWRILCPSDQARAAAARCLQPGSVGGCPTGPREF